jgi:hypothetical protein
MTLTSGLPVTTADVTAAVTLYFTPYKGNQISLFDGSSTWTTIPFVETAIAVPGTTSTVYDLFAFNNSGTMNLETQTWANDTTRAVGVILQNGIYVKSGATTRRYLGTFRTTTVNGQTEDSLVKRYVWNYYNRVDRPMKAVESTNSWTYSIATYRQANANAANQLDFVIGVSEDSIVAHLVTQSLNNVTSNAVTISGIGLDSTTVNSATLYNIGLTNVGTYGQPIVHYNSLIAAGRHTLVWLENGNGSNIQTWYGKITGSGQTIQTGITGNIWA